MSFSILSQALGEITANKSLKIHLLYPRIHVNKLTALKYSPFRNSLWTVQLPTVINVHHGKIESALSFFIWKWAVLWKTKKRTVHFRTSVCAEIFSVSISKCLIEAMLKLVLKKKWQHFFFKTQRCHFLVPFMIGTSMPFYFKFRNNYILGYRLFIPSATLLLKWHGLWGTHYTNLLCRSFQNTFTHCGCVQLTISYNSLINT